MTPEKFCVVPWIHLNPEPSGKVKPCCAYHGPDSEYSNVKDFSLEEIWNNKFQKKLRAQFLKNETPAGCATCVNCEDSGGHSLRKAMNDRFEKHIEPAIANTLPDGQYNNFNLVYWDFRFSNICNFKCRMCGHGCSSSWYEESYSKPRFPIWNSQRPPKIMDKDYYGRDLMPYVDQFIDVVEEIYFAGGEPLMMPEHYQILDKLIEKNKFDVFLRYNTNLSTLKYKSYDLIDIWKKFDKVQLFLSLDGFGANAEYSRSGTDWPRVESNLKKINEEEIPILISSTINIFNVFHFPDFINHLISLNVSLSRLLVSVLIFPNYYQISVLSPELKLQLKEKYANHLDTLSEEDKTKIAPHYSRIYYYLDMPSSSTTEAKFVKEILKIDKRRNECLTDVVPEYRDWFNKLRIKHKL